MTTILFDFCDMQASQTDYFLCVQYLYLYFCFSICATYCQGVNLHFHSAGMRFVLHRELSGENLNIFLHRTLALVWTGIRSFPQPSTVLVHSVTIKSQKCHLEGTFAQSPGYIASRSLIALTKPKSNCSWNNMLMFMILIKYN